MDTRRAEEIVSSPVMADVTYNGSKVYMEQVNERRNSCVVHYLDKPDHKLNVPLSNLVEH